MISIGTICPADYGVWERVERLYADAFPRSERRAAGEMRRLAECGRLHVCAIMFSETGHDVAFSADCAVADAVGSDGAVCTGSAAVSVGFDGAVCTGGATVSVGTDGGTAAAAEECGGTVGNAGCGTGGGMGIGTDKGANDCAAGNVAAVAAGECGGMVGNAGCGTGGGIGSGTDNGANDFAADNIVVVAAGECGGTVGSVGRGTGGGMGIGTDKGANDCAAGNVAAVATGECGGEFCGFITWWDFGDFVYGEHFAMLPECRGAGIGGEVIDRVVADAGKPVVLEVELPTNDTARRRIGFYERHGFTLCDAEYVQPPYDAGGEGVPMRLMSHGMPLDAETFERVRDTLYAEVYGVAE